MLNLHALMELLLFSQKGEDELVSHLQMPKTSVSTIPKTQGPIWKSRSSLLTNSHHSDKAEIESLEIFPSF